MRHKLLAFIGACALVVIPTFNAQASGENNITTGRVCKLSANWTVKSSVNWDDLWADAYVDYVVVSGNNLSSGIVRVFNPEIQYYKSKYNLADPSRWDPNLRGIKVIVDVYGGSGHCTMTHIKPVI